MRGPPIPTNIKKYYNNSNNKCKKVYECLVTIENVLQCSQILFFFFLQTPFLIRAKVRCMCK